MSKRCANLASFFSLTRRSSTSSISSCMSADRRQEIVRQTGTTICTPIPFPSLAPHCPSQVRVALFPKLEVDMEAATCFAKALDDTGNISAFLMLSLSRHTASTVRDATQFLSKQPPPSEEFMFTRLLTWSSSLGYLRQIISTITQTFPAAPSRESTPCFVMIRSNLTSHRTLVTPQGTSYNQRQHCST